MAYDDVCKFPLSMVGTEVLNCVYIDNDSTQRISMGSKAQNQCVIIEGAEFPRTFTGYETSFGKYTLDKSVLPDDVVIIKIIKKYAGILGQYEIKNSPKLTVFYKNKRTGKIGHLDIDSYRYLSPGFGYFTKQNKQAFRLLKKDTTIPKNTEFTSSSINNKPFYNMGINVNVAYMSLVHTSSDPVLITEELAEKCAYWTFEEITMYIQEDKIPIGLYNNAADDSHKFMPDIGEVVNEQGVLSAFRPFKFSGLFSEYNTEEDLTTIRSSDAIYRAKPGATIVDIDIYTSPKKWERIKSTSSLYHQLYKYQYQTFLYYKEFLDIYDEYHDHEFEDITAYQISQYASLMPKLTKSKEFTFSRTSKFPEYLSQQRDIYNKDKNINFSMIRVIIAYKSKVGLGDKFTNRHGNKGTVGAIIPTEHAPVDEFGFRVDMVINSEAVDSRMNYGQNKELLFNRMGQLVVNDSKDLPLDSAFNYIISFVKDYNPSYGDLLYNKFKDNKAAFVNGCYEEGLFINNPVTLKHLTPEKVIELAEKYNYRTSKLKYTLRTQSATKPDESDVYTTIVSENEIEIGSVYCYLLNKHPHPNAVELAYVSQFGLPIKNPNAKNFSIPQTAIRLIGEQEQLILEASEDPKIISRFLNVNGNSPIFAKKLFEAHLRAEGKSVYGSLPYDDKEIQKNNVPLILSKNILMTAGIDITNEAFFEDIEDIEDPELDEIERELEKDDH